MPRMVIQNMIPDLRIIDCGLSRYEQVLGRQQQMVEMRRRDIIPDTVLMVEHMAVVTLGARRSANKLKIPAIELEGMGIDVAEVRRGGGVTAHNPGQLVIYPIMRLTQRFAGVTEYVRSLEEVGIKLLAHLGVNAHRQKGFPGLWVGQRKIGSLGVRVSRQIAYHGMAINIYNDLHIFDWIIPCGLDKVEMTSAQLESGQDYTMSEVKQELSMLLAQYWIRS